MTSLIPGPLSVASDLRTQEVYWVRCSGLTGSDIELMGVEKKSEHLSLSVGRPTSMSLAPVGGERSEYSRSIGHDVELMGVKRKIGAKGAS